MFISGQRVQMTDYSRSLWEVFSSAFPAIPDSSLATGRGAEQELPQYSMNEADTCRTYVVPKLHASGWDAAPYSIAEQRTFTNPKGRVRIVGGTIVRGKPKRADYIRALNDSCTELRRLGKRLRK